MASSGGLSNPYVPSVLVVDDEPLAAEVLARMLQQGGYRAVAVNSARAALAALERADPRFHLLITDVVMPETDGRTLGRIIGERHPGHPVLYVSAYPSNDVFHRGAPDPLVPFLQKPFLPDAMLMLVRRLMAAPVRWADQPG
jgi:DNA-binding NtrC family response regulator